MLTSDEYKNFTTEFSKAVTSKAYSTDMTDLGEYMIPVGKMHGVNEGVKNKIVFAKGTMSYPEITRIVEIDADNETDLVKIRSELYGAEREGIRSKDSGIFKIHASTDYGYKSYQQASSNRQTQNNLRLGIVGGTGSRKTQRIKEILFDDEGNEVKREYRHKSRTSYTSGQVAQMKANLSHQKVYTKTSAMQLVNELAPKIRNRSFEVLADELWRGLRALVVRGSDSPPDCHSLPLLLQVSLPPKKQSQGIKPWLCFCDTTTT